MVDVATAKQAGKVLGGMVVLAGVLASILNFVDNRYVTRIEMQSQIASVQTEMRTQMEQVRQDVRRWMACGLFQFPAGCEQDLQRELSGFRRRPTR